MADVPTVPLGRPPARNWLPAVTWTSLIVLAVVLVKPWGEPGPAAPQPTPTHMAASSDGAAAATPRTDALGYDPRLFGGREPDPAWELWPAGYVVQFGFAGPLPVLGQPGSSPGPGSSPAPSPGPVASGPPAPSHDPGASGDPGPSPVTAPPTPTPSPRGTEGPVVDLGPTNHLIALGINTPLDVQVVDFALWFADPGRACCERRLEIIRLPTLWESLHFTAIAVVSADDPLVPGPWPVGEYRLDLATASGEVRSVRLRVTAALD